MKQILKRGQHDVAKILCLGFGLAVASVLIAEVFYEQTMETWFPHHERVYQVFEDVVQNGQYNQWSSTSGAIAPGIQAVCPQVEVATRYTSIIDNATMDINGRKFKFETIGAADSCFFSMFPLRTIQGNLRDALSRPYYCAISRSLAEKIGGNVIGQHIKGHGTYPYTFTIGGVYDDFPWGSGFHGQDVIVALSTLRRAWNFNVVDNWVGADRFQSYVRLVKGTHVDDLKANVKKMIANHKEFALSKKAGVEFNFSFVQITKTYTMQDQLKTMCWIMSILALILLVSTVMNYIIIVMGNMMSRFREMAVRKCFGARQGDIYAITFRDTIAHLLAAILLAVALLVCCKGTVEYYISAPLTALLLNRGCWIWLTILFLILLLGGYVPGRLYNRMPVANVFRGQQETRHRWKAILLAIEFFAVSVMLCLLAVIMLQYRSLMHEDMGYDTDNLAVATIEGAQTGDMEKGYDALGRLPEVEGITSCSTLPIESHSGNNIYLPGDDKQYINIADQYSVSDGYLRLMKIPVVAGRNFIEPADSNSQEVMVSESFVSQMKQAAHWGDHVIGKRIFVSEHGDSLHPYYTICGVYKETKLGSGLEREQRASVLFHSHSICPDLLIRLHHLDQESMDKIRGKLQQLYPGQDVTVTDYHQMLVDAYASVNSFRMGTVITGITALIIALMGLIGYTNDEVNRRRKEIAIRKVNGATDKDIYRMLTIDLMKVSLPTVVLGAIVAWIIAGKWLQLFADRINLHPLIFLSCIIVVIAIIVLTLSYNCRKVVRANPTQYLKEE